MSTVSKWQIARGFKNLGWLLKVSNFSLLKVLNMKNYLLKYSWSIKKKQKRKKVLFLVKAYIYGIHEKKHSL